MHPKLIYIMGTSYSGSTFFSSALCVHPQIETAGQLHRWIVLKNVRGFCSCGKNFVECEFWGKVWRKWEERTGGSLDAFSAMVDRYEHVRRLGRIFADRGKNEAFRQYTFYTQTLMDVMSEVSGRPIVTDASKYPIRGFTLLQMPDLDVRLIHLVRNGPSYLASILKRREKPKSRHFNRPGYALYLRGTLSWILVNLQAEYINHISRKPAMRVRYEDFISHPENTFAEIDSRLELHIGLQQSGNYLQNGGLVSFRHSSGNSVKNAGDAPIRISDSWKKLLEPKAYYIFNGLAGWLAKRYGYSLLWPE